ncbi:MAG: PilZ domain-containing protein [Bacillota bacterium]
MLVKCEIFNKDELLVGDGLAYSEDNVTIQIAHFRYMENMEVKVIQKVVIELFDADKTTLEVRVMMMKNDGFVVRKIRKIYAEGEEPPEEGEEEKPKKLSNIREDVRMDIDLASKLYLDRTAILDIVLRDLSCGGVRFSTHEDLDEAVQYKIDLNVEEPPINLPLKIVRKISVGTAFLYGCQFLEIDEKQEQRIRSWIFAVEAERRKRQLH